MFDAVEFAGYVSERWLVVALSCGIAAGLAFTVSELTPRRYTAMTSVLIRPPGDPRGSTVMSPVYLESLKVYETFASSDTVFARGLAATGAAAGSPDLSKKRILKVSKPAGTALLEISVTLRDPAKAQALAQYIAEQTVSLNVELNGQFSADLDHEFQTQLKTARERVEKARQARLDFDGTGPLANLEGEVQEKLDLKFRLERDLELARTDLAEFAAQRAGADDRRASAQAKIDSLTRQDREISDELARKGPQLDRRRARLQVLEDEERAAETAFETANKNMNEMLSTSPSRSERLQIIDPGIVPGQPSSPNTLLNVAAAFLFSFAGSMIYLAFAFSHSRLTVARAERTYSLR